MFSRAALRLAALVAVPGLLIAGGSAGADTEGAEDPRDQRPFDIVFVRHGHGHDRENEAPRLQHTIRFRKRFTGAEFRRDGRASIRLPQQDEYIEIFRKDGRWRARYYNKSHDVVGHPQIWRPNRRTFRLSFPRRWIEPGVDSYRWQALSYWYPDCPEPDEGPPVACTPPPPDVSKTLTHDLEV